MKLRVLFAGALALLLSVPLAFAQPASPPAGPAAPAASPAAPAAGQEQLLDRVVAIVDDDVILYSQFEQALAQLTASLKRAGRELPPAKDLRHEVFNHLVVESLELQMAQRAGVHISDEQLNDAMQRIAQQQGMTLEQFSQSVTSHGMSYAQAREQIRREMLVDEVQRGNVNHDIQVTDQEIDNFLKSAEGKDLTSPQYHIEHLLVPVAADADPATRARARQEAEQLVAALNSGKPFAAVAKSQSNIEASDLGWRKTDELPDILAPAATSLHKGGVAGPIESPSGYHVIQLIDLRGKGEVVQQTKARHILLKPSAIRSDAETEQLAEDLRNRIKAGASFAALARQYSEDIGSAAEGGELDWTTPGQLVPSFQKAMDHTQIGDISQPFRTRYGWHIVQVEDRRLKDVTDEMRRNIARNYLHQRQYKEALDTWLRKIRDEAYVDIKMKNLF